jgi:hypothetical protein
MDAKVMRDMDTLVHDKQEGFYDPALDMWFSDLGDWLNAKHGKTWGDVL